MLEAAAELPNMPPAAAGAGALDVGALLFKKVNDGFVAPGSADTGDGTHKTLRTRNHRKALLPTVQSSQSLEHRTTKVFFT